MYRATVTLCFSVLLPEVDSAEQQRLVAEITQELLSHVLAFPIKVEYIETFIEAEITSQEARS